MRPLSRLPVMLFFFSALASAAEDGGLYSLRGRLLLNGRRYNSAKFLPVVLEPVSREAARTGFTNLDGSFAFKELPAGYYYLSVREEGFSERRQTFVVSKSLANKKREIEVQLEIVPGAPSEVEENATISIKQLDVPAEARQSWERALKAFAENHEAEAVRLLERSISLAPDYPAPYNLLGTYHHRRKNFEKSISLFTRAHELDPRAFEPLVNLGGSLISVGRYLQAIEINRQALALRPHSALAHAQLGMAYFFLGQNLLAKAEFLKAKQLDPNSATFPQLFLADIYLAEKNRPAALREFEDYLQRHPDAPEREEVTRKRNRLLK